MGLLAAVESLALRNLPGPVVGFLRDAKRGFKLRQAAPVVQMYVNDGCRSIVGVHNFYSTLIADRPAAARFQLAFHDPDGRLVLRHAADVPAFGALGVDVAELFRQRGIAAPFGIVTVQGTPHQPRRRDFRELGRVTAHYFMFYYDAAGSVGQTHPLATTAPEPRTGGPFVSDQVLETAGLDRLELLQYNNGHVTHAMRHVLVDERTRQPYLERRTVLAPRGAALVRFDLGGRAAPARLLLSIDDLPTANAKPVIRRIFANGLSSFSHA